MFAIADPPAQGPTQTPLTQYRLRAEAERRAAIDALETPIVIQAESTVLSEWIHDLGTQADVEFLFDARLLWDMDIDPDIEMIDVDFGGNPVRPRDAIESILTPRELSWDVLNGRVIIMSLDELRETLHTRVYDLSDLVMTPVETPQQQIPEPTYGNSFSEGRWSVPTTILPQFDDFPGFGGQGSVPNRSGFGSNRGGMILYSCGDGLINLLTETIEPDSWDSWGGPGTIGRHDVRGRHIYAVRQTRPVLEEIELLLAELRLLNIPAFGDPSLQRATDTSLTQTPLTQYRLQAKAERRAVLDVLETPIVIRSNSVVLSEWLHDLGMQVDVVFQFDNVSLQEIDVDLDQETIQVDFGFEPVRPRHAIDSILFPLELSWDVLNGRVVIMSKDVLAETLHVRVLDLSDLITETEEQPERVPERTYGDGYSRGAWSVPTTIVPQFDDFQGFGDSSDSANRDDPDSRRIERAPLISSDISIALLTETIDPESWDSWGGPGVVSRYDLQERNIFVIRQTRPVLKEIGLLLAELRLLNISASEISSREREFEYARLRNSHQRLLGPEECDTRIYDLTSRLSIGLPLDAFCEYIETKVEPNSWDVWGGLGTKAVLQLEHRTFFIVRQTETMHREVEAFFHEYESTGRLITVE